MTVFLNPEERHSPCGSAVWNCVKINKKTTDLRSRTVLSLTYSRETKQYFSHWRYWSSPCYLCKYTHPGALVSLSFSSPRFNSTGRHQQGSPTTQTELGSANEGEDSSPAISGCLQPEQLSLSSSHGSPSVPSVTGQGAGPCWGQRGGHSSLSWSPLLYHLMLPSNTQQLLNLI